MNATVRRTTLGLLLAASAPVHAQYQGLEDATDISASGKTAESVILSWPTFSYRLARLMLEKYGQPAQIRDRSLTWIDNGPWKKTVVYRQGGSDGLLNKNGRLEQTVAYRVPPAKASALASFDKELEIDAENGRLTSTSDAEIENILALNLADEVVKGRRAPREAAELRRKLSRLGDAGKSSSYLDGLTFVSADQFNDPESPD